MGLLALAMFCLAAGHFCSCYTGLGNLVFQETSGRYNRNVDSLLSRMNNQLQTMNRASSERQWKASIGEPVDTAEFERLVDTRVHWRNRWCNVLNRPEKLALMHDTQRRQTYLLCRGTKYTPSQVREVIVVTAEMSKLYVTTKLCTPTGLPCLNVEPDLQDVMETSRDPSTLLWAWQGWRDIIGPCASMLYPALILTQNLGAKNNGYKDAGEVWREELETPDLEEVVEVLYGQVKPLYRKLHAYVRFRLASVYHIDPRDLIPAHLLGNMWAQNWEALTPLLLDTSWDLEARLLNKSLTVEDMVKHAEEFYMSLGLPSMVPNFWTHSQLVRVNDTGHTTCHAAAADMFTGDDFRILMCAKPSLRDFQVIHHEMGHIHYYMAYSQQAPIFQAGANSAFHESVGDAVMYGVMSPLHLERLGLVTSSCNASEVELVLLLRSALNKLPQLGFSLALEKWRWAVMRGEVTPDNYNSAWWNLHVKYLGVRPPIARSNFQFDAAAKSHVLDNIPYIRYFLSGFLQVQFLETMCKASLPEAKGHVPLPLHRCDIYGSLEAGARLRKMMSLGASVHWRQALLELTDGEYDFYSAQPLLTYYSPLSVWLDQQISIHRIPVWTQ